VYQSFLNFKREMQNMKQSPNINILLADLSAAKSAVQGAVVESANQ